MPKLINIQLTERKRIQIQSEYEETVTILESTTRAKKTAENEATEANNRCGELTLQVNGLTQDKRRLEADIGAMQTDMDEAVNGRHVSFLHDSISN